MEEQEEEQTEEIQEETEEEYELIPEQEYPLLIKGKWLRFREKLPFRGRRVVKNVAPCIVILGLRGTGKSSLCECLATHYAELDRPPEKTGKILDFFASRDSENLAWCRSKYSESILFVGGTSTDVSSSWDYKHINEVKLSDFRKYKVVIAAPAFFSNLTEEHYFIQTITEKLRHRTYWNRPWALIIREAANLIFSRISIGQNEAQAKAGFIYMVREARHSGLSVLADAVRFKSIDIDLRQIADFTAIKSVGMYGLPAEIRFIYGILEPFSVMKFPPELFILLTKGGAIAKAKFEFPEFHKLPKENLLKILDIQIEHGEVPDYGDKGFKAVSDFEHVKMIRMRLEDGEKGRKLSLEKISKLLQRSSATPFRVIRDHNAEIDSLGFCSRCKRARETKYMSVKA